MVTNAPRRYKSVWPPPYFHLGRVSMSDVSAVNGGQVGRLGGHEGWPTKFDNMSVGAGTTELESCFRCGDLEGKNMENEFRFSETLCWEISREFVK